MRDNVWPTQYYAANLSHLALHSESHRSVCSTVLVRSPSASAQFLAHHRTVLRISGASVRSKSEVQMKRQRGNQQRFRLNANSVPDASICRLIDATLPSVPATPPLVHSDNFPGARGATPPRVARRPEAATAEAWASSAASPKSVTAKTQTKVSKSAQRTSSNRPS